MFHLRKYKVHKRNPQVAKQHLVKMSTIPNLLYKMITDRRLSMMSMLINKCKLQ